jgi:hypothetical protein
MEKVWPLDHDEDISFGVRLNHPDQPMRKGEQIYLDYGNRANSYLLNEYGFTLKNNPFDYVRLVYKHPSLSDKVGKKMKSEIKIDLKKSGFNFDWILYLRLCHSDIKCDYDRET